MEKAMNQLYGAFRFAGSAAARLVQISLLTTAMLLAVLTLSVKAQQSNAHADSSAGAAAIKVNTGLASPTKNVLIGTNAATNAATKANPPNEKIASGNDVGAPRSNNNRYRIGAGDVLDIRIFNRPQVSRDAVRVDGHGMIRMPLIDDEIPAACHTEGELAREVAKRYLPYLRNPHVDVFVKEFQSQPVAVIGSVNAPGRFQLQRQVRLLELISFAGGPTERAGLRVKIVRPANSMLCEATSSSNSSDEGAAQDATLSAMRESIISFNLKETLGGNEKSNPFVQPGDIVNLPEADQVYVVGNVLRPTAIPIKEPITISRAIAAAGGTMPDTKNERVRILRQDTGGTKTEIFVDLKAINKRRAEDIALQANDIIDVPSSGGKKFLRTLANTIAPSLGTLPMRVIP